MNGRYKGKDKIGMLIKDFHAKSSSEMHFSELARGLRHFKETKKGRDIVCEKVKKYARQYALDSKQIRGSIFRPSFNKVAKKIDYKNTLEEW